MSAELAAPLIKALEESTSDFRLTESLAKELGAEPAAVEATLCNLWRARMVLTDVESTL